MRNCGLGAERAFNRPQSQNLIDNLSNPTLRTFHWSYHYGTITGALAAAQVLASSKVSTDERYIVLSCADITVFPDSPMRKPSRLLDPNSRNRHHNHRIVSNQRMRELVPEDPSIALRPSVKPAAATSPLAQQVRSSNHSVLACRASRFQPVLPPALLPM